jgi:glucan exporter ATP-binding protein
MLFFHVYGRALRLLGRDLRLAALLCLTSLIVAGIQFLEPVLFGRAIELLPTLSELSSGVIPTQMLPLLMLWAALSVAGIGLSFASSFIAERIAHRNRLKAISLYHDHVLTLPLPFHQATHSGHLMRTMMAATDALMFSWLAFFRDQLTATLSILVLLPLTLLLNWQLALCLVALMVVFTTITAAVINQTETGQRRAEDYNLKLAGTAQDAIANVAVVQSFTSAAQERRLMANMARSVMAYQFPVLKCWAIVNMLSRSATTLTVLGILAYGTWLYGHGQASVADIVSFMGFATLLIGHLQSTVQFTSALFLRQPVIRDFFEVLDTESSVPEAKQAKPLQGRQASVVFDHVSFAYAGARTVLNNVSFEAKAGSSIALVGHTGAGKTTAMALLQRHWDPTSGRILINGEDLRQFSLASLRKHLGVVFQDSMLFNRSVADNLRIADPDATMAEIEQACRMAEAHEFIVRMPRGYDTVLGERGTNLSGGQKQRLAIARALLKDPPILILDEATSALDAATESRIGRALAAVMKGRTTFIIAHRLSTIRAADEILVLHEGAIVERGSFDALVAQGGRFAALVHAQLPVEVQPLLPDEALRSEAA